MHEPVEVVSHAADRGYVREGSTTGGYQMDTWVWVLIVVAAVVVLAAVVTMFLLRRRRRHALRDRFGPEYDRRVDGAKSRRKAEGDLAGRAKRRDELELRPLSQAARDRYAEQWEDLQSRFVDVPQAAVVEADELIVMVMRDRGYPVDDFESQSALVSVDHPSVVQNYRIGHDVRDKSSKGEATTEDLRQGVVAYRALFDELLNEGARS
jgi:uncharacterized membrane protein